MPFVTIQCPDPKCRGVVVLGIDEWGSIFGKGQPPAAKEGVLEVFCPRCEKPITVGFQHVMRK